MTDDFISRLEALGRDATEGPWHRTDHGWTVWKTEPDGSRFVAAATGPNTHADHARGCADAHFIAISRNVWDELVAVVREASKICRGPGAG